MKKPKKKVSVIRIDDFKDLSETEQVERVMAMLRSLSKPSKNTNQGT